MKIFNVFFLAKFIFLFVTPLFLTAQVVIQPDQDGLIQQIELQKLSKNADYGIFRMERKFSFSLSKGIDKLPVVAAEENATVDLVSLKKNISVSYLVNVNSFKVMDKFQFEVSNGKNLSKIGYKPEKISLTSSGIFMDDNVGWIQGFDAPDAGCRGKLEYRTNFLDAKYLARIFFNEAIPVKTSVVEFAVPNWLRIDFKEMNFQGYAIKKNIRKEKNSTIYTFEATNLKERLRENYSKSAAVFLPHLIISIRSFENDGKSIPVFANQAEMYKWYKYLYDKSGNDAKQLSAKVKELISNKKDDLEKIRSIYYWVQDNVRYIAFEDGYAGFIPESAQQVYSLKYGDCKGMANLVTEMLKLAGFNAHFAWIGTRDIPYQPEEVQSLCTYDHAISVLYHNNNIYFIDGTEKSIALGNNAFRIQGKSVLVEHGSEFKMEKVPPPVLDSNIMYRKANLEMTKGGMKGHVVITFNGESRNYFNYALANVPINKRKELLKRFVEFGDRNIESFNVTTSNLSGRDVPVHIEADIVINGNVTEAGEQKIFGLDFIAADLSDMLPSKDRLTPMDLGYFIQFKDEITLRLMNGQKVSVYPPNQTYSVKNNLFSAEYALKGNDFKLTKNLVIGSPSIEISELNEWKSFINKIKAYSRIKSAVTSL
ncbi:MAG: transglutaminase-like domain-containing protein [Sediminibacterium sp.]